MRNAKSRCLLKLSLIFLLTACYHSPKAEIQSIHFSAEQIEAKKTPFHSHLGKGPWDAYLSQTLPFKAVEPIRKQLEHHLKQPLKHRGEAHITVITPVEYWHTLRHHLSIQDIHKIAKKHRIQNLNFTPYCIGQGRKAIGEESASTYYLVVTSPEITQLREAIRRAYVQAGGHQSAFKTKAYHPHITLGFTHKDLHANDGVIKNKDSCVPRFQLHAE